MRVIGLVDRAEYKRRQYPPGTKVSKRAFGKDRRLPMTSKWRESWFCNTAVTSVWHDVVMSLRNGNSQQDNMSKQQVVVLRTVEERDIRFIRLWFTDIVGTLKSVAIAPAELENAFEEGIGFDGSAIEGFARELESDMVGKTRSCDLHYFDRGRAEAQGAARMFCDITLPNGQPSPADPRNVLRRILEKAAVVWVTPVTPILKLNSSSLNLNLKKALHLCQWIWRIFRPHSSSCWP
jgi:hypothetical protein